MGGRARCYSSADLRKGEAAREIFDFIEFRRCEHGALARPLVFDSRLTTYAHLARLAETGIGFITLRRRPAALLQEVAELAPSARRRVTLDVRRPASSRRRACSSSRSRWPAPGCAS
jgi:hypothetical protein